LTIQSRCSRRDVQLEDIPTFAGSGALRSTMTDMLKFAPAGLELVAGSAK
jgi:hypothetical protein